MAVATQPPFSIKQGDTARPIKIQCLDQDGNAVNLASNIGATFKMTQDTSVTPKIVTGTATITDATNGYVQYTWVAGDTDTVGNFRAEFVITYASGEDTFPSDSYILISIYAEL